MNAAIPNITALKARLQATWSAGDFGRIAQSYEPGAQAFIARLNLAPGSRVLDRYTNPGRTLSASLAVSW